MIKIQQDTIEDLKINVADDVIKVIQYLAKIDGKIIVTGIGKSALVGMKVAATLNSTGSPSVFMHGSDALHGGLGAVKKGDIVICISKSGNNSETIELINSLMVGGSIPKLLAVPRYFPSNSPIFLFNSEQLPLFTFE